MIEARETIQCLAVTLYYSVAEHPDIAGVLDRVHRRVRLLDTLEARFRLVLRIRASLTDDEKAFDRALFDLFLPHKHVRPRHYTRAATKAVAEAARRPSRVTLIDMVPFPDRQLELLRLCTSSLRACRPRKIWTVLYLAVAVDRITKLLATTLRRQQDDVIHTTPAPWLNAPKNVREDVRRSSRLRRRKAHLALRNAS